MAPLQRCPAALPLLVACVLLLVVAAPVSAGRRVRRPTDSSSSPERPSGDSLDSFVTQVTDFIKAQRSGDKTSGWSSRPADSDTIDWESYAAPRAGQWKQRQQSNGESPAAGNTKPSSSGDNAASQASGGDNVADAGLKGVLDQHNSYRARHGVPALSWSTSVASSAQSWANGCVFEHSRGKNGENLAQGHRSFKAAVDDWYSEASQYQYGADYSPGIGHFTQMVWKATTDLGCGVADCGGQPLYVCQYSPAGNVIGEFAENVLPPGDASRET